MVFIVIIDCLGQLLTECLDLLLELLLALLVLRVDTILVNNDALELLNLILGFLELAVLTRQVVLHLRVVELEASVELLHELHLFFELLDPELHLLIELLLVGDLLHHFLNHVLILDDLLEFLLHVGALLLFSLDFLK